MLIDYPWYFVLFCLLAGAAYAAVLYYMGHRRFQRGINLLLASLRFLAVSAICMLLLAPVARRTVHERQQPLVVLVDDCSQSVAMCCDSLFSLRPLADELKDNFRIQYMADTTNPGQTDLSALLSVPSDAAALVLASDGIHNRGQNPTTTAERMAIPVYTVALGDTTARRDAAIANLRHNRMAYLGNTFPVEVTLAAQLLPGHSAQLTVTDGRGRQVESRPVSYEGNDFGTTLTLSLKATEVGLQRYTLTLSPAKGEVDLGNNRQSFFIDVIDSRRRVAIVGNAPHPDLGALHQAIESNPNYQARVMLADAVPSSAIKDSAYSLVILHNLPSATHPVPKVFDNIPQLFIIGTQTDLPRFNALHAGLEIFSKVKKASEVTALYNPAFSLFAFDADEGAAFEQLPPLAAPFGEAKMSASVQNLFTARLGSIDTRQPLVAATAQATPRRSFVWGEGLWKWRLADYQNNNSHDHFDQLVGRLVNFTAITDQRNRFSVETERHLSTSQTVIVNAQLYNDAFEPYNTPEATFSLSGDTLRADYTFGRQGNAYQLSLGRLPEGIYRYTARVNADGETLTAEGSFAVDGLNLEQANLRANHTLLRTVSAITGGSMVYPDGLDSLKAHLSTLKPVIYTHTRFSELIGLPWVFLLILLLLGAEWVLRKYHGFEK